MAAHPTQPLVAVGDDAGTVTLWEINPAQPKKLAQLTGLQISVKCVEFHRELPVVAAACSDKVLMWRFDQINREQEQQQEGGAVQQLEPSHTVCVFGFRSQEVVEQELRHAAAELEQVKEQVRIEYRRKLEAKEEIPINFYDDQRPKEEIVRDLTLELDSIRMNARNEVSCIAFHPKSVNQHTSYISVGVNNNVPKRNRIHMYEFTIEPSSSYMLHSLPIYCRSEIRDGKYPENEKVLLTSFSHNGELFAFVTKSLDDGTTVIKVMNFKGRESRYEPAEFGIGYIRKKCNITCISPYRTDGPYSHDGSFYKFPGRMYNHYFIIGCDDGSLMAIKAVTIYVRRFDLTRVEHVGPGAVWNAGEAIECIAVHPSLPLFASGSRNAVQVWDAILGEKTPRVVQPQVTPVISVGFNNNFLTACGRGGGVHVYSCNSNDYHGFKEELKKELQSGTEIAKYSTELVLADRQGECSICGDPMNDELTQPSLRSGPPEAEEVYLECGHKFHKACIERWLNQGKPCPLCRSWVSLEKTTPRRVGEKRQELQNLRRQQGARVVAESLVDRLGRYEPRGLDFGQGAAAASSAPEAAAAVVEPLAPEPPASAELTPEQLRAARLAYFSKQQQQPPESNGGGIKNKYSRKKYGSKKLKFRRRHSKKYNKN
jgi:WD40 repeat protein